MASNTNFTLATLDPEVNKANFIAWLQSQARYQGFNFAGANFNVLLDTLMKNTFQTAFYQNMALTESFIDTAQLRDDVVSRAKELNYLPSSMASSFTYINLSIQTANLTSFTIPEGTGFNGLNSNGSFIFRTDAGITLASANSTFNFNDIPIYEGQYTNDVFVMPYQVNNQLFTLSNPSVDITSLSVAVSEDGGSIVNIFQPATNIFNLNGNSLVYFIQGGSNNQYQFYFGDNVFGYKPQAGAVVTANYRVTLGPLAGGISEFTLNDNLAGFNNGSITSITITANGATSGGANIEGIESIRYNAPKVYQTMGRAVTGPDYKSTILNNFSSVGDVNVYGGSVIPGISVTSGTVFIAMVSTSGNPITNALKSTIVDYLQNVNILQQSIITVDANTLFLNINANVYVNFSLSGGTTNNEYKVLVSNTMLNYSNSFLQRFNQFLNLSKLGTAINNTDISIISNEMGVTLEKIPQITLNSNNTIQLTFNNPIEHMNTDPFILSTGSSAYISDILDQTQPDEANGTLWLLNLNSNNTIVSSNQIGSVNYFTGAVSINNLFISGFANGNQIGFYAIPQNQNILAVNNDILEIAPTGIKIQVLQSP